MGALKNDLNETKGQLSDGNSIEYKSSLVASVLVAIVFSALGANYPTIVMLFCIFMVVGGIVQITKKEQSKQKKVQMLFLTAAFGFSALISFSASKNKNTTIAESTVKQQDNVTVQSESNNEYQPLTDEDIDQNKLSDVKKEMAEMKPISEAERKQQLQLLKEQSKIQNDSLSKHEQYFNKLRMSGIGLETVEKVQVSSMPNIVKIVVSNSWHSQPYQIRLQAAQGLQKLWGNLYLPESPDRGRIELVDLNGNKVGGSKIMGGVWVNEN
jgi:hypothetical protein